MNVRFVVDENSIDLNGLSSTEGLNVIECLLDCLEDAYHDGHGACYDEELFCTPFLMQRCFWDLCDPESPIYLPPEVQQRAAAVFGRMPRWYDVDGTELISSDVTIDGGPTETTASVAWAHQKAAGPGLQCVACISARGKRRHGIVLVEMLGNSREIWFVQSASDMEKYFRWIIAEFASNPDEISALASAAFKKLIFVDGCFNGIPLMSKPCRQLAATIVHHLSAFSDEGQRIFKGPWQKAPAEFGPLGVDISDENGATKRNQQARRERCRVVDGEELVFWWHSKIERHQDRIHIYPNRVPKGGLIVVGIFCHHLTV